LHDDLPTPKGRVGDTDNETLRAFLGKVKVSSVDPSDPMRNFDHGIGRESALALYRQHLERFVDAPAVAAARANWLAAFG
jgi:hypothetical protein